MLIESWNYDQNAAQKKILFSVFCCFPVLFNSGKGLVQKGVALPR